LARSKLLRKRGRGHVEEANHCSSSNIILGVYLIIFGLGETSCGHGHRNNADVVLGTALLEFQIPQQVARYASFMFSFLGRGLCKRTSVDGAPLRLTTQVYIFIGSVIVGEKWFRIVPGTLVGIIGIAYAVLEYIPSIEPPANMRYVVDCRPAQTSAANDPCSDADAGWGAEQV
jgi:hypothetical protein|tara:strand:+ start:2945 stop:3466 length:522 start_codon:yes stop_codon:yes gene_type:complete